MQFYFDFLPGHSLYRLHEDVMDFFEKSIACTVFDKKLLFSPRFLHLLDAPRSTLIDKFRTVFINLNRPGIDKKLVFQVLSNNNNVREIIINPLYVIMELPMPAYRLVTDSINELFNFLWDSTINTKATIDNYGSLDDHYKKFCQINDATTKRICPFCGLERLKDPKAKRNEYDHYLNRKFYPTLSINFANLTPMCDSCNKSPNKGVKKMIVDEETLQRRSAYYPYDIIDEFIVNIDELNLFPLYEYQTCTVDVSSPNLTTDFFTWKKVFDIEHRYSIYLESMYESWLINFHAYFFNCLLLDFDDLLTKVNSYIDFRNSCALEPGDFIEQRFWVRLNTLDELSLEVVVNFLNQRAKLILGI